MGIRMYGIGNCREFGWEALLNRAGTTFRKLSEQEKTGLTKTLPRR